MQPYTSNNNNETDRQKRAKRSIWQTLGTLYHWRRFITYVTLIVAAASVVLALLLPDWYKASTRLLPPTSSGGGDITNFLSSSSDLAPIASSLLGSSSGDYMRFMSLLTSRSVMGSVVDRFNLQQVYETADAPAPRIAAINALEENVEFDIDDEFDHLSIVVYDKDPQRSAEIANYFAKRLNERFTELSSEHSAQYRKFVEKRYQKAEADLDSARIRKQHFEEKHGVAALPTQTQEFIAALAKLRASTITTQIELDALKQQYGPENTQVTSVEHLLTAAQQKQQAMLSGDKVLLPVAYEDLPVLSRRYANVAQEVAIQEQILKYVRPLYEQALFDEQRTRTALQIIDPAVPPAEAEWPPRGIICIAATLSAFLLAIIAVLSYSWLQRNQNTLVEKIQAEKPAHTPTPSA